MDFQHRWSLAIRDSVSLGTWECSGVHNSRQNQHQDSRVHSCDGGQESGPPHISQPFNDGLALERICLILLTIYKVLFHSFIRLKDELRNTRMATSQVRRDQQHCLSPSVILNSIANS